MSTICVKGCARAIIQLYSSIRGICESDNKQGSGRIGDDDGRGSRGGDKAIRSGAATDTHQEQALVAAPGGSGARTQTQAAGSRGVWPVADSPVDCLD